MKPIATIAWLTFKEARRKRMVAAALALGAVFLAVYATGFAYVVAETHERPIPEMQLQFGYGVLVLAGFYVIHLLTIMLTIFSSAGAISNEITSHTVQSLVTKPVRRADFVVGKWLGQGGMLALYLGLMGVGVLLAARLISGYTPPQAVPALLLLVFESLVLLSLSILVGTRLSTLANGVLLFLFYGLVFTGSWIGRIGSLLQSEAATRVGTVMDLLLPVEVLWRRAAHLMQPPILGQLPVSPFTGGPMPGGEMVLYATGYLVAALALATLSFSRRDL